METERWNHGVLEPGTDDIADILDCVSKFMVLLDGGVDLISQPSNRTVATKQEQIV